MSQIYDINSPPHKFQLHKSLIILSGTYIAYTNDSHTIYASNSGISPEFLASLWCHFVFQVIFKYGILLN